MRAFQHAFLLLILPSLISAQQSENRLAVIEAGVQRSEDSPYVSKGFEFLPGEYVYFTFHISGFAAARTLHLEYELTPQDANHVALTEEVKGSVTGDVGKEDKSWTPKRRASFLLPSFVAAGIFNIHVVVKDLLAKTETVADFPFQVGGIHLRETSSIQAENFVFLRNQDDSAALEVPAYAPGDTVWARFLMTGFQYGTGHQYKLSYGVKILRPGGKSFLDDPNASQISAGSFYPAPYLPGDLQVTTPKNAARGNYTLTLTVRDEIANQTFDLKRTFTIE